MASFPLVSPTGMLGSGFQAESLDKAISRGARMIGCDAGSTDPGPGPRSSRRLTTHSNDATAWILRLSAKASIST
jgi:hypothetical protein